MRNSHTKVEGSFERTHTVAKFCLYFQMYTDNQSWNKWTGALSTYMFSYFSSLGYSSSHICAPVKLLCSNCTLC